MRQEWEIRSRSHECAVTGRPFAPGEKFYTLLFEEKSGFRREDVCLDVWEKRRQETHPFCFWKSTYAPPTPRQQNQPLGSGDAESLLRHLLEENKPETLNARYILALMLERKRKLRPLPSPQPGLLVYEHPESGEVWMLQDPMLRLEQLEQVSQEVAATLKNWGLSSSTLKNNNPATPEQPSQ